MNIQIQALGFIAKTELLDFIKAKTEKLLRRCGDLVKVEVVLKIIDTSMKQTKRCEIRMIIPGNDLMGNYTARTFEEAVLLTIEILERRLESRKNKRIDYSLLIL